MTVYHQDVVYARIFVSEKIKSLAKDVHKRCSLSQSGVCKVKTCKNKHLDQDYPMYTLM